MSFQLIGAGSDLSGTQTQMNKNILELQNNERTTIFKDDTGTRRVLMGKGPNGFYGLKVSKDTFDVYDAADEDLVFNSGQNVFKIVQSGTTETPGISLNTGGAFYGADSNTTTVTHNLGYIPAAMVYIDNGTYYEPVSGGLDWSQVGAAAFFLLGYGFTVNDTSLRIYTRCFGYNTNQTEPGYTVKYYLLQETAN